MDPVDPISTLRQELRKLKDTGHVAVQIDALDAYLASAPIDKDHYLATFNATAAGVRATYEAGQREFLEYNRFAIEAARFALQSAMYVNGGAAVAMLAFIGNLWKTGGGDSAVKALALPEGLFAFGVLSAAIGGGFAYLTQYSFVHHRNRWGYIFTVVAMLLTLSAYLIFGAGVWQALAAFQGRY